MRPSKSWYARAGHFFLVVGTSMGLAACGGSTSSPKAISSPSKVVNNVQPIDVSLGPANNYVNGLFADVTICAPGSSNCQTVTNVLVDTGSEGLRLLSSVVNLPLPAETDASASQVQECVAFSDGSYLWGPVRVADIGMAGEKATSVPVQLVSANPLYPAPSQCSSGGGPDANTMASLGANGILGIGVFQQDCGATCASSASPALYYVCSGTGCQPTSEPLSNQLQNPVALFPQDNNGFIISLPSVPPGGQASLSGSLIFGIGTQSNNDLGSAKIYTTDPYGDFQTVYKGVAYNMSFIDSGSNALYFLDSATLGIPDCSDSPGYYCPASTASFTVANTGLNGLTGQVSFNIANGDVLGNSGYAALGELGGDSGTSVSNDYFDFGLPFFYGRSVFIGIENKAGPNGNMGPYWAY
jgi:Protein of unknown function (DUF3443)